MRRHQHKHVLQEDERVVQWDRQQGRSQDPSKEEVEGDEQPLPALLVHLEDQRVPGGLGLLDPHDVEAHADNGHEEHGHHHGQREDHVTGNGCGPAARCGVVAFGGVDQLHDGEERQVKVAEHVVADVHVELELRQELS